MVQLRTLISLAGVACVCVVLSSCGGASEDSAPPTTGKDYTRGEGDKVGLFGEGGIAGLFSGDKKKDGSEGGGGLGVNSFLWRAALETISFMPVVSADPFGGVVITDWQAAVDSPDERFKLNVYILGRELRADVVVVRVFRQVYENGQWKDTVVPTDTGRKIEDAILTKARQFRHESLKANG